MSRLPAWGPWRAIGVLGRGRHGTAWRVADADGQAGVVVAPHVAEAADLARRRRALRLVQGMPGCPGLVPLLGTVVQGDGALGVWALMTGGTLGDRIADPGPEAEPWPWSRAARALAPVAQGLAALAARDAAHRDLHPGNLFWDAGGGLAIGDLDTLREALPGGTACSSTGGLLGSVRTAAPEAVAGEGAGPAADVYALGVILWRLLTGRWPAGGSHPAAVLASHAAGLGPPPAALPEDLRSLLRRLTARDPAARPGAAAVAGELASAASIIAAGGVPLAAGPAARPPDQRTIGRAPEADWDVGTGQPPAVRRQISRIHLRLGWDPAGPWCLDPFSTWGVLLADGRRLEPGRRHPIGAPLALRLGAGVRLDLEVAGEAIEARCGSLLWSLPRGTAAPSDAGIPDTGPADRPAGGASSCGGACPS